MRRACCALLAPLLLAPLLLVLAACNDAAAPAGAAAGDPARDATRDPARIAARAETLMPADPRLAAIYDTSCRACHASALSGAPLAGDSAAWAKRWAQGLPTLVDHTIGGFNGMPAGGQCFACSAADYEALIRFLAGHGPARSAPEAQP